MDFLCYIPLLFLSLSPPHPAHVRLIPFAIYLFALLCQFVCLSVSLGLVDVSVSRYFTWMFALYRRRYA